MFGIRSKKTKKMLGVSSVANPEDCEGEDVTFTFWEGLWEIPWLVKTKIIAENARQTNTFWYNAKYETPKHGSVNMNEMEVFEANI